MFPYIFAVFVALQCTYAESKDEKCFPKGVERLLLNPPDAWKLMTEFNGTFYLVYHSEMKDFKMDHPCLSVTKSTLDTSRKCGHYRYTTFPNTTMTLTGTKEVTTKTKDAAYANPNVFVVPYYEGSDYKRHDIQLLYTDYTKCAVLKSKLLGIQMWVSKTHLEEQREVPFVCALVYDLAADKPRQIHYDWKECPLRKPARRN